MSIQKQASPTKKGGCAAAQESVPREAGLIGSIPESRELKARDLMVPLRRGKSKGLGMKSTKRRYQEE